MLHGEGVELPVHLVPRPLVGRGGPVHRVHHVQGEDILRRGEGQERAVVSCLMKYTSVGRSGRNPVLALNASQNSRYAGTIAAHRLAGNAQKPKSKKWSCPGWKSIITSTR